MNPPRLVFVGGMGGAGRTTAAMLVACASAHTGVPVALEDLDSQGTATTWQRGLANPRLTFADTPAPRQCRPAYSWSTLRPAWTR